VTKREAPGQRREAAWSALGNTRFDLLVVGGGITGAGVARDAAMRGLRVALVEKGDFASGTSSRSSRLIHGGLRYLEHAHFKLVFEASREREVLLRIAPHLVQSLPFTWPVYRGARIGFATLEAGLIAYDGLSLLRNTHSHRPLTAKGVSAREPMLETSGLRGGALYYDAATDDARLTLSNVLSAVVHGATVLSYVRANNWIVDGGHVVGAVVVDELEMEPREQRVHASVVVDATGPWRGLHDEKSDAQGTKGTHIAVPRDRIGNREAITLLSPMDGRVMFILPAGPCAIIGTTDLATDEHPDEVRASVDEIRYLMESANAYFPAAHLEPSDVISAWAGIRPLAAGTFSGDPASASREHDITVRSDCVIAVSGGKLTTYRAMATEVVDCVQSELDSEKSASLTASEPLPGADRASRVQAIVANDPSLGTLVGEETSHSLAEVEYSATEEMAFTLGDLLIRRTHIAFELRDQALSIAPVIAQRLARIFEWDAERCDHEVRRFEAEVARIFGSATNRYGT
jgi:glycerol-3-phosphate dehydrogenase